jgi:sulfide:quinone oxidoreductase
MDFQVVVAGGGIAAIEAVLALREFGPKGLEIEMISPTAEFTMRPLSVAQPFGGDQPRALDLTEFCAEHGVALRVDSVDEVWGEQRRVLTGASEEIFFDALLLAFGAKPFSALPGALAFRGSQDVGSFERLLKELARGEVKSLAFAVPAEVRWSLPLCELALLTAHQLRERGVGGIDLTFVTHEEAPLAVFGSEGSERIAGLLKREGIEVLTGRVPERFDGKQLLIENGEGVEADRVVTMPGLSVPEIPGVPQGRLGFIGTDVEMRVEGLERVWAAGDMTWFPIKQGGLAAQQAEVAAAAISATAGSDVERMSFKPVIRGVLLTGRAPQFMRVEPGMDFAAALTTSPLWWPPGKVAGRRIAPYLAGVWGEEGERPQVPMQDFDSSWPDRIEQESEHRDALNIAFRFADNDARQGDLKQALRWLDVAEKLNVTLPPEYVERRREWRRGAGGS